MQSTAGAAAAGINNGQSPTGFAAGALYLAGVGCGVDLTQTEICEAVGVSVPTLSKQSQRIKDIA